MHGGTLGAQPLPAGANLKRALIAAMLEWIDKGWQIAEFSSRSGMFAAVRASERRMIAIQQVDPAKVPQYGASHLFDD